MAFLRPWLAFCGNNSNLDLLRLEWKNAQSIHEVVGPKLLGATFRCNLIAVGVLKGQIVYQIIMTMVILLQLYMLFRITQEGPG